MTEVGILYAEISIGSFLIVPLWTVSWSVAFSTTPLISQSLLSFSGRWYGPLAPVPATLGPSVRTIMYSQQLPQTDAHCLTVVQTVHPVLVRSCVFAVIPYRQIFPSQTDSTCRVPGPLSSVVLLSQLPTPLTAFIVVQRPCRDVSLCACCSSWWRLAAQCRDAAGI